MMKIGESAKVGRERRSNSKSRGFFGRPRRCASVKWSRWEATREFDPGTQRNMTKHPHTQYPAPKLPYTAQHATAMFDGIGETRQH